MVAYAGSFEESCKCVYFSLSTFFKNDNSIVKITSFNQTHIKKEVPAQKKDKCSACLFLSQKSSMESNIHIVPVF